MSGLSPNIMMLLNEVQREREAWVSGRSDVAAEHMAHSPDFTIAGPFGGAPVRGWTEHFQAAQARAAAQFRGGTSEIQLVSSHESNDLIVLVMVERGEAQFDGSSEPQDWTLRVTQVYRRDGMSWKIVHRHADPLIERRTLNETVALVSKREKR